MDTVTERVCLGCGETKKLTEFYRHPMGQYGRNSKCKECNKEYARLRRKNPEEAEKLRAYDRKRKQTEESRASRRANVKIKRRNDPKMRIDAGMRKMLEKVLKFSSQKKDSSAEDMLGYSRDKLVQRLECQFQPGMSWDNYGKHGWHIDHKKPISAFLSRGIINPKTINALCNLQPLWAHENHVKWANWKPLIAANDNKNHTLEEAA